MCMPGNIVLGAKELLYNLSLPLSLREKVELARVPRRHVLLSLRVFCFIFSQSRASATLGLLFRFPAERDESRSGFLGMFVRRARETSEFSAGFFFFLNPLTVPSGNGFVFGRGDT